MSLITHSLTHSLIWALPSSPPLSLAEYVICTMKDDKTGALQIVLEPMHEEDNRRKWEFR